MFLVSLAEGFIHLFQAAGKNLPRHYDRTYPDAHLPAAGHQFPDETGRHRQNAKGRRPALQLAYSHLLRTASTR